MFLNYLKSILKLDAYIENLFPIAQYSLYPDIAPTWPLRRCISIFSQILTYNSDSDKMAPFPLAPCMDVHPGISRAGGSYLINRLFAEGWQGCTNLHRDVQTDAYATDDVIARKMTFASQAYPSWTYALTREALGVVLPISAREIEVRDLAHFLHLAVGHMYLRSHSDQTYMYENGALMPLNGVMPESLFPRCKEYAAYVEGCVCRLGIIFRGKTDEGEIPDAIDLLFRPITSQVSFSEEGAPGAVGFPRMGFGGETKGCGHAPLQTNWKTTRRQTD